MSQEMLLVYGTLLQKAQNPMAVFLKRHSTLYARAYFIGHLYDLGSYPGARYDPDTGSPVYGDLLILKEVKRVFEKLDLYEDYNEHYPDGSLYLRQKVSVISPKGKHEAWTYLFNHSTTQYPQISSGDYAAYLKYR